ncbi:MAG: transketolase C-terminal domain-containing protein [Alphaproteobacteria bacterium]|nr:transketolase C-terminal domain-containing protein [Alphaproteobacteria bacterium]
MRKTCVDMVYTLAKKDPRVVFIGSDLSPGLLKDMKAEFPDRTFMEGVAEQNIIGMAAGFALEGYIPYVNTIATFITRRCFEQVAVDACLHHLPIRLIANGGGLVYAPLGPTHLAIEDIAIMRSLPNMTVVAVSDAEEMTRFMEKSLDWPHPIYIRMAKGGDPIVSRAELGFEIGKAILLKDTRSPNPVLLITTGITTNRALTAAEQLEREGIHARVLHMHTIKPLDEKAVLDYAADASLVMTVEEHTLVGGLGSAVAECLMDNGAGNVQLKRLGIPDSFAKHYGTQDDLLKTYGLQPDQIAQSVRDALRDKKNARLSA